MRSHAKFSAVRTSADLGQPLAVRRQRSKIQLASHPAVPVLPETLVQLDLLLGKSALDLEEISQLILTDVGATLQVFRSAYNSGTSGASRVNRISDCIVHLGKARMQAAFPAVISRHQAPLRALWERARLAAEVSELLAPRMSCVSPERAYLAGLLHEIGRVPAALGWCPDHLSSCDSFTLGCAMIKEWRLPVFFQPSLLASPDELHS